jgi:uncharacterized damage-inducible protein DinB
MSRTFPSPTDHATARAEVYLGYLDYFRSVLVSKLEDVPDEELRNSRLPSGWTPLELLKHLTYVERRWLMWGFEGSDVDDPWGDSRDGRWYVGSQQDREQFIAGLHAQSVRSRAIVERHDLSEVGQPGQRWDGAEPATLERVLLHLVQEYARHAGHLDVVRELIDGRVGE